jgi:hypothetical protein
LLDHDFQRLYAFGAYNMDLTYDNVCKHGTPFSPINPEVLPSLAGSIRALVFVGEAENANTFGFLDLLLSKGSVERLKSLRVLRLYAYVWHSHRNTFQFSSTIRRFSWKDMATASRGSDFFSFQVYANRLQSPRGPVG